MSLEFAGAIATALAVTCLVLIPLGSSRLWELPMTHPERSVLREAGWTRSVLTWECVRATTIIFGLALASAVGATPLGFIGAAARPSLPGRLPRDDAKNALDRPSRCYR